MEVEVLGHRLFFLSQKITNLKNKTQNLYWSKFDINNIQKIIKNRKLDQDIK